MPPLTSDNELQQQQYQTETLATIFRATLWIAPGMVIGFAFLYWQQPVWTVWARGVAFFLLVPITLGCLRLLRHGRLLVSGRLFVLATMLIMGFLIVVVPAEMIHINTMGLGMLILLAAFFERLRQTVLWAGFGIFLYYVAYGLRLTLPIPEVDMGIMGWSILYGLAPTMLVLFVLLGRVLTHNLNLALRHSEQVRAELTQSHSELAVAKQEAERANVAKSQFLANMSHELRTPLNAIVGYAEMLVEDARDEGYVEQAADLEKITYAAHGLLQLINDVLDLSKIEAGYMEIHPEKFAVADMVREVTAVITPLALQKGNQFFVEGGDITDEMEADFAKVRQTLLNLLGNANKFTEAGHLRLTIGRGIDPNGDYITFEVQDTGIGMTAEQLAQLFKPFTQADASITRRFGGTGLGLAISQRFCQMMGGRIEVRSQLGKGSVFTVVLPL